MLSDGGIFKSFKLLGVIFLFSDPSAVIKDPVSSQHYFLKYSYSGLHKVAQSLPTQRVIKIHFCIAVKPFSCSYHKSKLFHSSSYWY